MNIAIILVLVIAAVVLFLILKNIKTIKPTNLYFVSGAVKSGKSYVCVALAVKQYKKHLTEYYLKLWFYKFVYFITFKKINRWQYLEKPMLYSNIKLRHIKHNRFTIDILLRKKRVPYKSVVLLDETSLIADSMLYKDKNINDNLLLFYKLWGHMSRGGFIFANSQSLSDNHFSLKRCLGRYLYLYDRVKYPFVSLVHGIELINSEDNQTGVNSVIQGDIEKNVLPIILSNKYYSYYDCYCYSIFTDDLTIDVNYDSKILSSRDSLKTDKLVSLQDFKNIDTRFVDKEKDYA